MYHLYFDETGSRHPGHKSDATRWGRDWFALGGFLIRKEDEEIAKAAHNTFIKKWNIRCPLHITDMLAERQGFGWLGLIGEQKRDQFWSEYKLFLGTLPVVGTACVIDRPGYVARGYLETHKDSRWLLCRSAFDILVERAAKFARLHGRKLSVSFEGDNPTVNNTTKGYFARLKQNGLEFDASNSAKYTPLSKGGFSETLSTIEWKSKESTLLQIADSYVYAIARAGYDRKFSIYRMLFDRRRLINLTLENEHIYQMGIKYYCFELHRSQSQKQQSRG